MKVISPQLAFFDVVSVFSHKHIRNRVCHLTAAMDLPNVTLTSSSTNDEAMSKPPESQGLMPSGARVTKSATDVSVDALFKQLHVQDRQTHSLTDGLLHDHNVGRDDLAIPQSSRAHDRSDSQSSSDVLESRHGNYRDAGERIYASSPDSHKSHSCPECGNLLPELSERPREMSLAKLRQSADQGCTDCAILVAGYDAYARNHAGLARDAIWSNNTGGPLRISIECTDHPRGHNLEFYTPAGMCACLLSPAV